MKNLKPKLITLMIGLTFLISIKPSFALNNYSVYPGANFRWDATKYFFMKDGLGLGNDLEYTHTYYLEFNFTNWAGLSGAEYLNGTINSNGTLYDGELSFASYFFGTFPYWITEILDDVDIYLICNTEIEQSTIPSAQSYAASSWLTFSENSHYNFSLIGTYLDPPDTYYYTGYLKFNSDKVLSYLFDEMEQVEADVTVYIERYIWTLTYSPGTPTNGPAIPGFQIWALITIIFLGVLFVYKKLSPKLIKC